MKAIAICGSPRIEGNTERLLRLALARLTEEGFETRMIRLAGREIGPCVACRACWENQDRTCARQDDFQEVFAAMLEADVLLVGSPVYVGSAPGQLMALLDRAGYVARANGNLFSRKVGGPVVVARRAGKTFTFAQLMLWFHIMEFVVPGATYWNVAVGRDPGEVEGDAEGVQTVQRFAENLAWLAGRIGG